MVEEPLGGGEGEQGHDRAADPLGRGHHFRGGRHGIVRSDGGKGQRGSGFSDGNPNPGAGGSAGSGTIAPLGYSVGNGSNNNTANRAGGAAEGSNNSGGSGFVYILYSTDLTLTVGAGLTTSTGTYSGDNYVHITAGSGNISFS